MRDGIEKVGVIGAGIMGSGIAAHVAGAGIPVVLLDIVPPNLSDEEKSDPAARNRFAESGVMNATKAKPAAFFDTADAALITTGNLEDDFALLGECDLIIEVVIENMDIKQSLFKRIDGIRKEDAIVSSNTSGLSVAEMAEGLSESFQKHFLVTHFFNPVRYMHLLELVPHEKTEPQVMQRLARFGERRLGKGIVYGKDTTNFVANRIGVYSMMQTIHAMIADGFTIEQIDKIVGVPMGRPKSAAFRTADIVGLDTLVHVADNCYEHLRDDECRDVFKIPDEIKVMLEKKLLGSKTKAGFYKKEGKDILVYDYKTGDYRAKENVRYASLGRIKSLEDPKQRLKTFIECDDDAAIFAWKAVASMLVYSANRLGEIADDVVNIDRAMRWGFNWEMGPFEAWDGIGVKDSVARMEKDGYQVPAVVKDMLAAGFESFYGGTLAAPTYYDCNSKEMKPIPKDERELHLTAIKAGENAVVKKNMGASLIDLGEGILGLQFHTKMNTIDADVLTMLNDAVDIAEKEYEGIVIYNEDARAFSAGANLMLIYMEAQNKNWSAIEKVVNDFQNYNMRLKYAKVPVIAAPHQLTLGGGCEISMHCDMVCAHAETYIGLVEVGVGVIPAGGGTKELTMRMLGSIPDGVDIDPLKIAGKAFENIATAKVATGAFEAKKFGFFNQRDMIVLNRDHHLYAAKQLAMGMARAGYTPPKPKNIKALGPDAVATFDTLAWGLCESGWATEYDLKLAHWVGHIIAGGNRAPGSMVTEQDLLDLECEAFMSLVGEEKTQARMQHILMYNKPLRN